MLQISHLTLIHKKDLRTLVHDFSVVLNPGDKVAVIGEEGNGKSTLLQWIYDPKKIEEYCQWDGKASGNGSIGYLAQQLSEEEKKLSIYEFCSHSTGFAELSYKELNDIARQLAFPVEEYYSERSVGTLSGGEQIKLQLSCLLFGRAEILLLDEPSSDLDLETLRWLEEFIDGYHGIVLFISHDEALIEKTATAVLHIEHPNESKTPRSMLFRLDYQTYVQRRNAGIASQTQLAKKEREEHAERMERFRRIQQSVEHAQKAVSRQDPSKGRLLKKKMHAVVSMGKRFDRYAENMTQLPEVEEAIFLRFSPETIIPAGKIVLDYYCPVLCAGEKELARNVRLRVNGGEKIGIIGHNGAGKTTLIRLIAEELLNRKDLNASFMPQDYSDCLPMEMTVLDYLAPSGHKDAISKASTFLGSMRFAREEMFHQIGDLSGGQKAKVFLTQMMLEKSNVLILDEPTRNFSPLSGPQIREVLAGYGGSIVSVSHDRKFLSEVCDKIFALTPYGLKPVDKESFCG